eukprot:2948841-Rhodomonas_salina.1
MQRSPGHSPARNLSCLPASVPPHHPPLRQYRSTNPPTRLPSTPGSSPTMSRSAAPTFRSLHHLHSQLPQNIPSAALEDLPEPSAITASQHATVSTLAAEFARSLAPGAISASTRNQYSAFW